MAVFSKVFVVTPNVNEFALLQESSLALSIQETERKPIQLYGEPVKASWKCVDVEWLEVENEKALPKPDICCLESDIISHAYLDRGSTGGTM